MVTDLSEEFENRPGPMTSLVRCSHCIADTYKTQLTTMLDKPTIKTFFQSSAIIL